MLKILQRASAFAVIGGMVAMVGLGSVGLGFGCNPARFPTCAKNEDCADKGDLKYCDNVRCVQCRYDADCGDNSFCERKVGECKSLGGSNAPASASAAPSETPPVEPPPDSSGDPSTEPPP